MNGTAATSFVGEPVLAVGVRPLPVEDVLAVTIRLEVEGERSEEVVAVLTEEVDGLPAARATDAARALERAQEREVEEREVRRLDLTPRRLATRPTSENRLVCIASASFQFRGPGIERG